jgi:hypothetical protein
MDWKVELVSSIEATMQAAVEKVFERSMYAPVEESADETARRTSWFGEAGRRHIELAEDKARRDPVWAARMARRLSTRRVRCAMETWPLARPQRVRQIAQAAPQLQRSLRPAPPQHQLHPWSPSPSSPSAAAPTSSERPRPRLRPPCSPICTPLFRTRA